MSPLTLRRTYLPRREPRPPPAHPPAAAAAAQAQAKHPHTPHTPEDQPTLFEPTNRSFTVKPFRPGHELETEKQVAKAFCRPPRTYRNDPPFYPWLPPAPKVIFNLNFKD